MKRYLVFAGMTYYPSGGWGDFQFSIDDLVDALNRARCMCKTGPVREHGKFDWVEVIDTVTGLDLFTEGYTT